MSDSHTNFDGRAFGAAAFGGAATLAGALVAGVANVARARANAWADWTRDQLVVAVNYYDALLMYRTQERDQARRERDQVRAEFAAFRAAYRAELARRR